MPLGVQLLNENKVNEMCATMKNMHKYVPKTTHQVAYQGESAVFNEEYFHGILFGGYQLTVCQSRGAQAARCNDDNTVE